MPDEITIMGIPYAIEYVEVVCKDELRMGQTDFMNAIISIDRTVPKELQEQTLIHEMLHAICQGLGLYEINENESAIQGIATALYDTFKSNNLIFS